MKTSSASKATSTAVSKPAAWSGIGALSLQSSCHDEDTRPPTHPIPAVANRATASLNRSRSHVKLSVTALTFIVVGLGVSTAAAALTSPGYYWTTARAAAAFRYAAWSSHSIDGTGLHCADQGRGACNFTVTCRGLAANPSTIPAARDVLKVGAHLFRYRYFRCVAASPCVQGGSWWQSFRTNTALPARVAYDAMHIRSVGGVDPVANPAGC